VVVRQTPAPRLATVPQADPPQATQTDLLDNPVVVLILVIVVGAAGVASATTTGG
jgi:hypothetical protein